MGVEEWKGMTRPQGGGRVRFQAVTCNPKASYLVLVVPWLVWEAGVRLGVFRGTGREAIGAGPAVGGDGGDP